MPLVVGGNGVAAAQRRKVETSFGAQQHAHGVGHQGEVPHQPAAGMRPMSSSRAKPTPPQGSSSGRPSSSQPKRDVQGTSEPLSAAKVLTRHGDLLSNYEKSEILEFTQCYYWGTQAKIRAPVRQGINNGFDDERGDYRLVMGDHILYRYEVLGLLGKGSFGQVVKCLDRKTGQRIALKIIRNKRKFHKQAMIEIRLLEHLKSHDPEQQCHIVQMHDHFMFRNHICMVFELHSVNIYEFIKLNRFQPLSLNLVKKFAVQLLTSLAYLNRENIIHCDLKPENILLRQANRASIKLIDFGSSCFENERLYTYMQSRFYRAPEVILGIPYGRPIDMWSFGCTMAELATGYPLFPGENETEQLACIMEVLGVPPQKLLSRAPRRKQFFDTTNAPRIVANSRGRKRRSGTKRLKECLNVNDNLFYDFVRMCLIWTPEQRLTPEQGLAHPWLADVVTAQQPAHPHSHTEKAPHTQAVKEHHPQPPPPRRASQTVSTTQAAVHATAQVSASSAQPKVGGTAQGATAQQAVLEFQPAPPFVQAPHLRSRNPESYLPSIRDK